MGRVFTVFIESLDVYAYHGVPEEERVVGHRYLADIDLEVEGDADLTDDLSGTVDYAGVASVATSVIQGSQFRTVERLAGAVADGLLNAFPSASEATVTIKKPMPPMPYIAEAAGATVVKAR